MTYLVFENKLPLRETDVIAPERNDIPPDRALVAGVTGGSVRFFFFEGGSA